MTTQNEAACGLEDTVSPVRFGEITGLSRRRVEALIENGSVRSVSYVRKVRTLTRIPKSEAERVKAAIAKGGLDWLAAQLSKPAKKRGAR